MTRFNGAFQIRALTKLFSLLGGLSVAMILAAGDIKKANASCAAPRVPYSFAALWENGNHANYVDIGIPDEQLATLREGRHNQNLVLDDIEYTWDAEDSRMEWTLSWVRGPGFGSVRTRGTIGELLKVNRDLETSGYRLIDIEYSSRGGKWLGLWRKGGNHSVDIKYNLTTRQLTSYANQRHREGWRLFDIERTSNNSADSWTAVWRNDDNRANYFNVNMTYDELNEIMAERADNGRFLVDIEAYRGAYGERRYAGIWTTGANAAYTLVGITGNRLVSSLERYHARGFRLIDIEAYEPNAKGEIGDVPCNDVDYRPVY